MSTTPADTAAWLDRMAAERRALAEARAEEIRRRIPAAVTVLKSEHGATRVWLFGSMAIGAVHEGSDVDLAVEGLPSARHFRAVADAERVLGAPLDLVRIEDASPRLRARIAAEGVPQ